MAGEQATTGESGQQASAFSMKSGLVASVERLLQRPLSGTEVQHWNSLQDPVSYTHLDVYKRQVDRREGRSVHVGDHCGSATVTATISPIERHEPSSVSERNDGRATRHSTWPGLGEHDQQVLEHPTVDRDEAGHTLQHSGEAERRCV